MKPTNIRNKNCVSTSSDCVIWDGDNLECFGICRGDSVTRVVYLLAKEVCTLRDMTDIANYPVQCLTTIGPSPDFKTLINNLITLVCSNQS